MASTKNTLSFCFLLALPLSLSAQIFTTDVIVQGSLCVGMDCVTTENFGFDTHRLKENNLRLHFDDTSNSGSFPANDWRITINDDANGGDNYFGIDDATAGTRPVKVEAGAGNNAVVVSSNAGNVGLGTDSPVVELQVTDGDSPALRLEQNGANGWTPQTWDVAGNETNFFVRDVTNSSNIPFKIKPGAPDNTLFLHASGDVSIGASTANRKLYINGGLTVNGDIYALSDQRIKKNIENITYGLSDIMKLSAKEYQFTNGEFNELKLSEGTQLGLVAQEVQTIIPEVVTNEINALNRNGETSTLKGVNYTALIPVLIKAIQEQQLIIESKSQEVAQLQNQINELNSKFDLIINQLGSQDMQTILQPAVDSDNLENKEVLVPSDTKQIVSKPLNNGRSSSAIKNHNAEKE